MIAVKPVSGEYVLGSPLASKSVFRLGNGKIFTIRAENLSRQNIYIQKAILNGTQYTKAFLKNSDIMAGGELVLFMDAHPSPSWGVNPADRPGK